LTAPRKRFYLRISYKVLGFDLCDSRGYDTQDAAEQAIPRIMAVYKSNGAHYVRFELTTPWRTLARMVEWSKQV
jgi:hypothetical protein